MDEECAAAWRLIIEGHFGGVVPEMTEDEIPKARASNMLTRDLMLSLFPFTEREITFPGPESPITLSVFTPVGHVPGGPGIVWIHGGGMTTGDRFWAFPALRLAAAAGAVVVSVEYRLAPEHPDPAPVDDSYAGLCWTAAHAAELGIDGDALVLAGSSAGGGIAAGTALRVRDDGGPALAGLLLLSPMLDDRMRTVSAGMAGVLPWSGASNRTGWRMLLGDRSGTDDVSIYAAPGRATDLSGLPPTFLDVGSVDLFRDEGVAFASTIWASGGDAEIHVWPGGFHGYEDLAPAAALSVDTIATRERWLTRTLTRAHGQPGSQPEDERAARDTEAPQPPGADSAARSGATLAEIQIRDPFLVTPANSTQYVLFGSTDRDIWQGPATGFDCWTSTDLRTWHGPVAAFRPPAGFWSTSQYWAPEVHEYAGRWHMLATFGGPDVIRGTAVLVADAPTGPFEPWSEGPVTPPDWECLDGTLHVDAAGQPWMVFCREWVQIGDGEVLAQRLTSDLRSAADEPPVCLFRASAAPWARSIGALEDGRLAYVTDGPFLHRTSDGTLLMLWSSLGERGYAMGVARSESGHVLGPWTQEPAPLWPEDGGHGMIAAMRDGGLALLLHAPNETPRERVVICRLREVAGGIDLALSADD
ncbi:alpha/beta hydrolase fold domain-containing protein [Frankia sp. CcI49]|uniref:alpha/beta hydrolase fold domain-containing protein n=1 Tax=Frankia sp. CcI49 TaxID=1745382 RepID=UPI0018E9A700